MSRSTPTPPRPGQVSVEAVVPQPGGFYGGWITSEVSGPFKGEPGPIGW